MEKKVCGYGIDIIINQGETDKEICNKIWAILAQNGIDVVGVDTLDTCWSLEEYGL